MINWLITQIYCGCRCFFLDIYEYFDIYFFEKCIKYHFIIIKEMLTDALRELSNNLFKEIFYWEKKSNNTHTIFFTAIKLTSSSRYIYIT